MIGKIIGYLVRKVPSKLLINLLCSIINDVGRIEMLSDAFSYVRASNIKGDYLEFGVYKGNTFEKAYWIANYRKYNEMKFYAFDSFEGLPDTVEYQLKSNPFQKGQFAYGVEEFKKNIRGRGVDLTRVGIVEGWFDKVLTEELKNELGLKHAIIVMIDCDLYKSTVPVLEFITGLVVNGSVLMFDDWFLFEGSPDSGVQKATYEWLTQHPEIKLIDYHNFGWHGKSFLVRKSDVR